MRVAITGITGSLGSALLRRLAASGAERIVGFSRDEQKRLTLQAQYLWHPGVKLYAGDIRDAERLPDIFYGCDVVIHAAARKVVSGHHDEPREMLLTNVNGTQNVLAAARLASVRKFLFVSSDKAVHPCNVYGVSKAMAEYLVVSENARSWAHSLRCSVIRYGNVLASNGSVVRIWLEKRAAGEALPLSDVRMTRFWLTVDQAVNFVLGAVADLRGGEIFVPVLHAAPLIDVAQAVWTLGTDSDYGTEMVRTVDLGIRPGGEKLHEELVSSDEARRLVLRNWFYVVRPPDTPDSWDRSPWLGDPVPPDFRYCSADWPHQWGVSGLKSLLESKR